MALLLTGRALSMPSMIGLIMLMGIVTKNSILLVDYAILAREGHLGPDGQPPVAPLGLSLIHIWGIRSVSRPAQSRSRRISAEFLIRARLGRA